MAKFREKTKGKNVTRNYMDGVAYKQPEKEELAFSVVSTFLEDSYYEGKKERLERIDNLVKQVAAKDPFFVAKLAILTRLQFNMRSAYHYLVASLARYHKGDSLVRRLIGHASIRPDDVCEIAAILDKPIPTRVKKGIGEALNKYDKYQLSKYKGTGKSFSLVDLFNLIHPVPKDSDTAKLWGDLLSGNVKCTDTWEARLSSGEDKTLVWKDLLKKDKLGYMALLRNLRNILRDGDSETIGMAISLLANKERVKKSKQLPFRFLSAFKALESEKSDGLVFEKDDDNYLAVMAALNKALTYSIDNIPVLSGKTVILSDNSGSMHGDSGGSSALSAHSSRTTADIANLFAVLYWLRANNTLVGLFGDRLILPKLDRTKDVFSNYEIIRKESTDCGYATEEGIFKMFEKLIDKKEVVDHIVIFSDCQVGRDCKWYDHSHRQGNDFNALFKEYQKINPAVKVYSVDLKGYGNKMFADGVFLLSGWSEKIFELMEMIDKKDGFVKYIDDYQLPFQI